MGSVDFWPQAYAGGWITSDGSVQPEFTRDPWPTWRFQNALGVSIEVQIFVPRGSASVVVSFRLDRSCPGARLQVRPLFAGRDFHGSHRENSAFAFEPQRVGQGLRFQSYSGVPAVLSLSNAEYQHAPDWYRNFFYSEEAERGLDASEDLASPGVLVFDLEVGEGLWVLAATPPGDGSLMEQAVRPLVENWRAIERRRRGSFSSSIEQAADAYLVKRGKGHTLIAGYPWFGDWGRDTFIALRGLYYAPGGPETARSILCEWAEAVSEGMLPNRFSDDGSAPPEFNSVDASLWFVIAADELLTRKAAQGALSAAERSKLDRAISEIVSGYSRGTRHGIRRDHDGLLAAGEPGLQLTWMDAKAGDWVVTPRIGKPVEVQALWIHALHAAGRRDPRLAAFAEMARTALEERFWNAERNMLLDVVDQDHIAGAVDPACRPNQIFAAGGLPITLLSPARARAVVDAVERELWTPLGLRSLERGHPCYVPRYTGGVVERDGSYHQGTVWPWLIGPFVEAWIKSRGATEAAKQQARRRFLEPFTQHLEEAGLGHISEIADAEPPHTPRGCPFQVWSVAEVLRLERSVLTGSSEIS